MKKELRKTLEELENEIKKTIKIATRTKIFQKEEEEHENSSIIHLLLTKRLAGL